MSKTTPAPVPDLTGRLAVVTGASDGIGVHLAARLAGAGAEVVLPVRDQAKGEAAVRRIRTTFPQARLRTLPLDLASLDSVARFAARLADEAEAVHLLVHNAGVMTPPDRQVTTDGFELQLATNHLGPFALTARLLPPLRAGSARVTTQVSIAARRGGVHWEDLGWERRYDAMGAYTSSKVAVGLFGLELQRRSEAAGWGITSNLSHPGVSPTNLLAAQPGMGRRKDTPQVQVIRTLSRRGILVGTAETAAEPAVHAATAPSASGGRLYGPSGLGQLRGAPTEQDLFAPLRSLDEAARVWTTSEELTGTVFGD